MSPFQSYWRRRPNSCCDASAIRHSWGSTSRYLREDLPYILLFTPSPFFCILLSVVFNYNWFYVRGKQIFYAKSISLLCLYINTFNVTTSYVCIKTTVLSRENFKQIQPIKFPLLGSIPQIFQFELFVRYLCPFYFRDILLNTLY